MSKPGVASNYSTGKKSSVNTSFEVKIDEFQGSMCSQLQQSLDKILVDDKGTWVHLDRHDPIF